MILNIDLEKAGMDENERKIYWDNQILLKLNDKINLAILESEKRK